MSEHAQYENNGELTSAPIKEGVASSLANSHFEGKRLVRARVDNLLLVRDVPKTTENSMGVLTLCCGPTVL